jgi:integrase
MARITQRLTAVKVANVKTKGLHADGNGLYLRVTATGTKSWIFRFTQDGGTHDMGLGPLATISLARARELAAEARRKRLEGQNPIAERRAGQASRRLAEARGVSFRACAEQLIASYEASWRNLKHCQQWRNTLATYVYPVIGNLSVNAIDTELVLKVLEPIWLTKPETAGRVRGRIEAVLNWAKARGLRAGQNPALWRGHLNHLLPPHAKVRRVRHHPALPYAEMSTLMTALRSRTGIAARALEFVILTAARTGEGLGARWNEIDLGGRMWTISAERMKAGREHRVPLSSRAIAILKEMAEVRQNEFVFPGMKQGKPLGSKSLLVLLRELRKGITTHGFRSTFKDWCAECTSTPNFVSEVALAHIVADKVEAAYRRLDLLEKRRELMDAWAAYCGRSGASGEVVPLRGRTML